MYIKPKGCVFYYVSNHPLMSVPKRDLKNISREILQIKNITLKASPKSIMFYMRRMMVHISFPDCKLTSDTEEQCLCDHITCHYVVGTTRVT